MDTYVRKDSLSLFTLLPRRLILGNSRLPVYGGSQGLIPFVLTTYLAVKYSTNIVPAGKGEKRHMDEPRMPRGEEASASSLRSGRGGTSINDIVVSKIAGIAAQEIEGIQMGGGTSRAVGGFLDSVTGGGPTRGVSVQVGEEEAAVDLSMAVEYGKSIPQISEAVRRNVINRVENLTGLRVVEVNIAINDVLLPEERPQLERQRQVEREAREQEMRP